MNTGEDLSGTGTEQLFGGALDLLKGNKRNHSGVRLIDELMVDIMGVLIPGVLFNFSLMVCIVLPIIIYEKIKPHSIPDEFINSHIMISGTTSSFGGWFWFAAFLTFLILSYIAGHIFYRSDINIADSKDIEKRKGKNANYVKIQLQSTNHIGETVVEVIQNLLISELSVLQTNKETINKLQEEKSQDSKQLGLLLEYINFAINKIKEADKQTIFDHKKQSFNFDSSKSVLYYALLILFPQNKFDKGTSNYNSVPNSYSEIIRALSLNERSVIKSYREEARKIVGEDDFIYSKYIDENNNTIDLRTINDFNKFKEYVELLITCYLIITLQNDSGCTDILKLSDYPYLEFYKYLLKRNETDLIRYVDWSPAGARTKNKINRMKINIQLEYPDAYAILNKNESHIRMAASSWHVSGFITQFAVFCVLGIIGIACIYLLKHFSNVGFRTLFTKETLDFCISHVNKILIFIPPVLLYFLMNLMRGRIEDFIHYQRLREIFFTLFIYNKLDSVKKLGCESNNVDISECQNENKGRKRVFFYSSSHK